jgi:hypothetical protein
MILSTSDEMTIAKAIISNPASIRMTFFSLLTSVSRLERLKVILAGSRLSADKGMKVEWEYWDFVFSRSPHVLRNLSNNLVGGLSSSNI